MFDNLIARAIVPATVAVTGFVVFGCILLYSFIKADMTAEATRQLDRCASTVMKATKAAMMEDDRTAIQEIVSNVGTRADITLLQIFDQHGNTRYTGREGNDSLREMVSSQLEGYLRGGSELQVRHEVDHSDGYIAVTLPIPNEPQCLTSACHVHSAQEPLLGFLTVGVSSSQLEKTLALLRNRMIVFSVMVLFLTVGGVMALLRMNLFLPLLRLTNNAALAAEGTPENELPESDHKLGALNRDFRRLVKERDRLRQELPPESDKK